MTNNRIKKWFCNICIMGIVCAVIFTGCNKNVGSSYGDNTDFVHKQDSELESVGRSGADQPGTQEKAGTSMTKASSIQEETKPFILPEGTTLETRFDTPSGYERVPAEDGSLSAFLREYSLKEDGSPVLLYDGTPKGQQNDHAAVFTLPLENEDLQQCADSVMRVYAEYYLATEQYDKIQFHFVDGFLAEYEKWREGYRIQVNGDNASWAKTASYDESYECFQKFMRMVFAYAGTLSMESESEPLELADIQVGDVFLKGGSPGHVVMVVDICEDSDGKKAFLLGQGYMPAQEFHVLKNPAHEEDPWYYEEEITYPFVTPEYTFPEGSLRRLAY